MTKLERTRILSAMHAAYRRGVDPYNSANAYAKEFYNFWRLNFYR